MAWLTFRGIFWRFHQISPSSIWTFQNEQKNQLKWYFNILTHEPTLDLHKIHIILRVNSLKRYSKGGNGKNEEFDQIWWKVLWHDGKTPRHSGPAWGGPWGILWGKFFFPDFWNFWNFFFQNALSQAWLIWPMWNLDMFWRQHEILIWRKKILKFRKFVKTTFFL